MRKSTIEQLVLRTKTQLADIAYIDTITDSPAFIYPQPGSPIKVDVADTESSVTVKLYNKNLIKNVIAATASGITLTYNPATGLVTLNGTASGTAYFYFTVSEALAAVKNDLYTLSANNPVANANVQVRVSSAVGVITAGSMPLTGAKQTLTFYPDAQITTGDIRVASGTVLNNFTMQLMLEVGDTSTDFALYSVTTNTVAISGGVGSTTFNAIDRANTIITTADSMTVRYYRKINKFLNDIWGGANSSSLYGKKVVNLGDSIFGMTQGHSCVSAYIARRTRATVYNCGFGGSRMSQYSDAIYGAFSMHALADAIATGTWTAQDTAAAQGGAPSYFATNLATLKGINFANIDIVTIAFGTTDFTASVALDNESDPDDVTCFSGALRYSIEKLLTAFPKLKIVLLTPTWRFWQTGGVYTEDSDTYLVNSVLLQAFATEITDVAKQYHLNTIDNLNELGINKFNRTQYFATTDGTHHIEAGRALLGQHVGAKLLSMY